MCNNAKIPNMFHVLNNIKFIWVYPEFISGRDHKGRAFRYNLFLFKEKGKGFLLQSLTQSPNSDN
ncbi:hypothetical protein OA85_05840 [Flavobacterium sp. AED]|nr:hypothetical protein OA85_05840 [Flavobacterium sp. AED]